MPAVSGVDAHIPHCVFGGFENSSRFETAGCGVVEIYRFHKFRLYIIYCISVRYMPAANARLNASPREPLFDSFGGLIAVLYGG